MQIVSQEIGAVNTSVTVKYSKICSFLPLRAMLRFGYIEDDSNSILVVLTDRSLVCRGRISLDEPIRFGRMLSLLKIGDGRKYFGKRRFIVILMSNLSRLKGELLGLKENLLPNDLFWRLGRRF